MFVLGSIKKAIILDFELVINLIVGFKLVAVVIVVRMLFNFD